MNKNLRVAAVNIVLAHLEKPPMTEARWVKYAHDNGYDQPELDQIRNRADDVLGQLLQDAKDLWDES